MCKTCKDKFIIYDYYLERVILCPECGKKGKKK